jgi:hypothetical protein
VIGWGGEEAQGFLEEDGGQREPSVNTRGRPRYLFIWVVAWHSNGRAGHGRGRGRAWQWQGMAVAGRGSDRGRAWQEQG